MSGWTDWRRRGQVQNVEDAPEPSPQAAVAPAEPSAVNGLPFDALVEDGPDAPDDFVDLGIDAYPPEPARSVVVAAAIVEGPVADSPVIDEDEPEIAAAIAPTSPGVSPPPAGSPVAGGMNSRFESAQGPALDFTEVATSDMAHAPYGAVCQLFMQFEGGGGEYGGTAFLVHPNMLMTAAHNLIGEDRKRAKKITILFDNGRSQPLKAVSYAASDGWNAAARSQARRFDRSDDYGVIFVDSRGPYNLRPVIPLRQSDCAFFAANRAATFRVCGFSPAPRVPDPRFGDIPFVLKQQYTCADAAWPIDQKRLRAEVRRQLGVRFFKTVIKHSADTVGGFSGGPLLARLPAPSRGAHHAAVGVHIAGHPEYNLARVIDAEVAGQLKRWLKTAKRLAAS